MIRSIRPKAFVKRRVMSLGANVRRSAARGVAVSSTAAPLASARRVEDPFWPPSLRTRKRRQGRRSGHAVFARELLANPRAVGAACPSSRWLARKMARSLPRHVEGLVLELGAGTGSITAALLRRGVSPQQLIVIERSPVLAAYLRRRFPGVRVIQGDAARLVELIPFQGMRIGAVVSSLPLRSLPADTVKSILSQLESVLGPDALFIQYTYALRTAGTAFPPRFRQAASRIVWRNLPPARIQVYMT